MILTWKTYDEQKIKAMLTFDPHIKDFIGQVTWTFARTMPDWPHEYIVRTRVDEELFVEMVNHIMAHGYQGYFYQRPITYFDQGGYT